MNKRYTYLLIILLIIGSCLAFGRVAGNDFVNYDDNGYITDNGHIKSGINPDSLKWSLTAVVMSNWHPVTLMSHMLDWNLFGTNAAGHHLVNLFFHIGSVILLFLFLYKTTNNLWPSAFAAAVFALHPLRVESVAWAAERKDVLSLFFGMACIYAYAFYAEKHKVSFYALCLILFILALMSKPMMVTLPFVLMLLDFWPLQRWTKEKAARIIGEKVPFIVLAVASGIITIWAQRKGGAVASQDILPFLERVANAIVSYAAYPGKIFWPVDLAVFYPYNFFLPLYQVIVSGIILIFITFIVLYYINKLPFLFVGWFWYLGTLVPVIGLVQVGLQSMADRYTYLPSIGIVMMLAWGIPSFFKYRRLNQAVLFPAAAIILITMMVLTWHQCGYWKNSIRLFDHALSVIERNDQTKNHRNNLFSRSVSNQRTAKGINNYARSMLIHNHAFLYNNRGFAYAELGQYQRAFYDFNEAIRLKANYIDAYNNRGTIYNKFGYPQQAIEDFSKAIQLDPNNSEAYFNRGNALINLGQFKSAIEDYDKVILLKPDAADAYNNRGFIYLRLGQYREALENYNKSIDLDRNYADAYNNRAFVYLILGDSASGCRDARKGCESGSCTTLQAATGKGLCR
jgi:protein O-mannosyl-transferase